MPTHGVADTLSKFLLMGVGNQVTRSTGVLSNAEQGTPSAQAELRIKLERYSKDCNPDHILS